MKCRVAVLLAAAAFLAALPASVSAKDSDRAFFQKVAGRWQGPGEIVAGKYKGTKFICTISGVSEERKPGLTLDGTCNVGVFTQVMKASVTLNSKGYRGKFMDGAAGTGLDITSGAIDGERIVFSLNRKQLDGAMLARLADRDTMAVTISVKVEEKFVPVIGMNLKRVDEIKTGSLEN
jgi:hypothetical protein